jgi:integrase
MKIEPNNAPLGIRISRVMAEGKVRFIIQNRESLEPLPALSIYEAYLSRRHSSPNSVLVSLQRLCFLYAWGEIENIDIDFIFLCGEMLEPSQVNAFVAWLHQRCKIRDKKSITPATINAILIVTAQAFKWFADQYVQMDCRPHERAIKQQLYKNEITNRFASHHLRIRHKKSADDLTEEEITKIEQFLKPGNRLKQFPHLHQAQALRDYLVWRLVIEFGLREGEVLALRLEDCPHYQQDFIKIVRIEERGENYADPREGYAPRPKTLSRELGFILKNSPIKKLINDYITKHRRRRVTEHGRKVYKPILDIPAFLILSHKHDTGAPLSIRALSSIAEDIRNGTGIEHFHWHIGRHAFFNRAYAAILNLKETDYELRQDRLRDLVYWGGWESDESLQLYINRARRHRAQMALSFYQTEQTEWAALT